MGQDLYVMWVHGVWMDGDRVCGDGYVKIGVARNIQSRRSELQVANPQPLRVIAAWAVGEDGVDPAAIERSIHDILHAWLHHVRGEWFRAGPHIHLAMKVAWAKHKYPRLYDRWVQVQGMENLMEPVTCPHCGQKHWSRQPCKAQKATVEELKAITRPSLGRGRPPKPGGPMSPAERVRNMRARRKAEKPPE